MPLTSAKTTPIENPIKHCGDDAICRLRGGSQLFVEKLIVPKPQIDDINIDTTDNI